MSAPPWNASTAWWELIMKRRAEGMTPQEVRMFRFESAAAALEIIALPKTRSALEESAEKLRKRDRDDQARHRRRPGEKPMTDHNANVHFSVDGADSSKQEIAKIRQELERSGPAGTQSAQKIT